MHNRSPLPLLTAMLPAALWLAACSGGGGGGGGGSAINAGEFTVESFAYSDPNPAGFQPLPEPRKRFVSRDELMMVTQSPGGSWTSFSVEDAVQNFASGPGVPAALLAGTGLYELISGDVDGDGPDEIVALVPTAGGTLVRMADPDGAGGWLVTELMTTLPQSMSYAGIDLADVDGDGLNELLVHGVSQGWVQVRVYADLAGSPQVVGFFTAPAAGAYDLAVGDFDGDGWNEITLASQSGAQVALQLFDDQNSGFQLVASSVPPQVQLLEAIAAGEFDGDNGSEFALLTNQSALGATPSASDLVVRGWSNGQLELLPFSWTLGPGTGTSLVTLDLHGDGVDEVAVLKHVDSIIPLIDGWELTIEALSGPPSNTTLSGNGSDQVARLAVADTDNNGQQELLVGLMTSGGLRSISRFSGSGGAGSAAVSEQVVSAPTFLGGHDTPQLVAGDFDGDGLVLRYTGNEFLDLPAPLPLVVMAAAPTWQGVTQNLDESQTVFGTNQSQGFSYGVSNSISASLSVGIASVKLLGLLSTPEVRATFAAEFSKTQSSGQTITHTVTFNAPAEEDTIVFQGTLYHCYEYEVLASPDPLIVGSTMILNVPVASNVYKWTVEFYNAQVDPAFQIGPSVLTHTVGDPGSYPTRAELSLKAAQAVGWLSATELPVGSGSGSISLQIDVTNQNSTVTERTLSVSVEQEYEIGGATFGASFGVSKTYVYEVTVTDGMFYGGTVGDIAPNEYSGNAYNWGLGVYHLGIDPSGQTLNSVQPYQVVTFSTQMTP